MKKIEKIENGTIRNEAIIDYENATYSEYTLIKSKTTFIFGDLYLILLFAVIFYVLVFWTPKEVKK